jgi:hypothetical protein
MLTLRSLSGSPSPVGAFPFSPSDPRYGASALSADFTAIVLHTGGPSLSFHRGVRTVRAGDVHVLTRGEVHRVLDFGRAEGIAVALQLERFAADLAPRLDGLPEVIRPAPASFTALLERAKAIHAEVTGGRAHGQTAVLAHAQLLGRRARASETGCASSGCRTLARSCATRSWASTRSPRKWGTPM